MNWENVETVSAAIETVTNYFETQIAASQDAEPNVSVSGDSNARMAFFTLLPVPEQRLVFLRFIKRQSFWPRIRSLVGSPPFSFLLQEDEGLLRAGGISRNRVNMSKSAITTSVEGFHFADDFERSYSIVQVGDVGKHDRMGMRLPFIALQPGDRVIVDVKIRKRRIAERAQLLREGKRHMLTFPSSGDSVDLTPNIKLGSIAEPHTIEIRSVTPSDTSRMLARVVCNVY